MRSSWVRAVPALTVGVVAGIAAGDWDPGDNHIMHFPQMPTDRGWAMTISDGLIGDDWRASQTTAVSGIHFWYAFRDDLAANITNINVSIYSDDRSGAFSQPGTELWTADFGAGDFVSREYGEVESGNWYHPGTNFTDTKNFEDLYQMNITDIDNPFIQQEGEIYWLLLHVELDNGDAEMGWMGSGDHFEDIAVWDDEPSRPWKPLFDPLSDFPMAFSFVITPTPSSLTLLAMVGLGATMRRRR